jgi:putative ABC transport system permease protein
MGCEGGLMPEFFRRIYVLLNRSRMQRELANDIAVHREMMGENRKDFGNPTLVREQASEIWGWGWLERFLQDIRFGTRMLRRSPGLTTTAIAVLALGIGVNVTAFNFVDLLFFRPLAVRDPHSLARFTTEFNNGSSTSVAYPVALYYREHSDALVSFIAQRRTQMTLNEREPQSIHMGVVTVNYLGDLGISAAYGRVFVPGVDDKPDAAPVAVLGYGFFQRHFAADPAVVNKTIRINDRPATVIGVLPAGFVGLDPEAAQDDDVWLLMEKEAYFVPDTKILTSFDPIESDARVYGRFRPGMSFAAGQRALLPLAKELERLHPKEIQKGEHLRVTPGGYAASFSAEDVPAFGLFAALVLLVLAITCGNLGNLLLGHAVTREREISIRLSLGATRGRIVRQLITESLLLAMIGSAVALLLSWYASRAVLLMVGGPAGIDLAPDWRTKLFAIAIGVLACVLFGLPAARQLSRQRHRVSRTRTVFMATQVAASCVLLVISALLVHALERAVKSDPGFDYKRVAVVDPQLYSHSYSTSAALQFTRDLKDRVLQIPGVESAAMILHQPLGNSITVGRGISAQDGSKFDVYYSQVDPDFFRTMGIPPLRGRTFLAADQGVAIVSESTARRLWPGRDALQQTYEFNRRKLAVVGVVGDAHMMAIRDRDSGDVYLPIETSKLTESVLLVRTLRPPQETAAIAAKLARALDPQLSPVTRTLQHAFDEKFADSVRITSVIGAMGTLALLLAAIGLYGVVSYNVGQRTKEIGIRMALGATPARVLVSVVSKLTAPLAVALAAGLALAGALSFILRSQLYGVHHLDPLSYLGTAAALSSVGALAALVPARRALKVDPMVALRCE